MLILDILIRNLDLYRKCNIHAVNLQRNIKAGRSLLHRPGQLIHGNMKLPDKKRIVIFHPCQRLFADRNVKGLTRSLADHQDSVLKGERAVVYHSHLQLQGKAILGQRNMLYVAHPFQHPQVRASARGIAGLYLPASGVNHEDILPERLPEQNLPQFFIFHRQSGTHIFLKLKIIELLLPDLGLRAFSLFPDLQNIICKCNRYFHTLLRINSY